MRIVRADGGEIIGDLSTVGSAAIDVEVDGRMVRLASPDVREVGVLDSPRNGILIGLGAGLAAGFGTGLAISQDGGTRATANPGLHPVTAASRLASTVASSRRAREGWL